ARQRCLSKPDPHFLLGGVDGADTLHGILQVRLVKTMTTETALNQKDQNLSKKNQSKDQGYFL
ncbi:hypothetical protein, partial [Pseudomonas syringae group genomosp. 3]|uniref:hypothetical protein n=1 Tax=Pseudomonas syringae group genomosp. 3 TaxID=251701 RepID=UPI001C80D66A